MNRMLVFVCLMVSPLFVHAMEEGSINSEKTVARRRSNSLVDIAAMRIQAKKTVSIQEQPVDEHKQEVTKSERSKKIDAYRKSQYSKSTSQAIEKTKTAGDAQVKKSNPNNNNDQKSKSFQELPFTEKQDLELLQKSIKEFDCDALNKILARRPGLLNVQVKMSISSSKKPVIIYLLKRLCRASDKDRSNYLLLWQTAREYGSSVDHNLHIPVLHTVYKALKNCPKDKETFHEVTLDAVKFYITKDPYTLSKNKELTNRLRQSQIEEQLRSLKRIFDSYWQIPNLADTIADKLKGNAKELANIKEHSKDSFTKKTVALSKKNESDESQKKEFKKFLEEGHGLLLWPPFFKMISEEKTIPSHIVSWFKEVLNSKSYNDSRNALLHEKSSNNNNDHNSEKLKLHDQWKKLLEDK